MELKKIDTHSDSYTILRYAEMEYFGYQIDAFDMQILYDFITDFLNTDEQLLKDLGTEKKLLIIASARKLSKLHSKLHSKLKSTKQLHNLKLDLVEAIVIRHIIATSNVIALSRLFDFLDRYLLCFS